MEQSKTIYLAAFNMLLASVAAFLPAIGLPAYGEALTDLMSRTEYIVFMGSLGLWFSRLGIMKVQKAVEANGG